MYEKHYVLQFNPYHTDRYTKWETVCGPYPTIEEAEAAKQRMPAPSCYRVAESYVVVRYKAVKM